ncbi:MAG: hypothetical protein IMX02_13515 [Limnochordaceae bacterium]|nr:hypothetical protein [Limnochordaceae bacterium]
MPSLRRHHAPGHPAEGWTRLGALFSWWILAVASLTVSPSPASAAEPFVEPLLDLGGYVAGVEAGWGSLPYGARLSAGAGWGFSTQRAHYRVRVAVPVEPAAEIGVGYLDWPNVYLLGQAREQGAEVQLVWRPDWRDVVRARFFHGLVGEQAALLDQGVTYGYLAHQAQVVYAWPLAVQTVASATYGQTRAEDGSTGHFYALTLAVPVSYGHLDVIPRLGYSAGSEALPGYQFQMGGYGDAWLRGYGPEAFSGPIFVNLTLEYRRAWLAPLQAPFLSELQMGPFVEAGAVAGHDTPWSRLDWHASYGLTAAYPIMGVLIGTDLAWTEAGAPRVALRASGRF